MPASLLAFLDPFATTDYMWAVTISGFMVVTGAWERRQKRVIFKNNVRDGEPSFCHGCQGRSWCRELACVIPSLPARLEQMTNGREVSVRVLYVVSQCDPLERSENARQAWMPLYKYSPTEVQDKILNIS